MWYPNRHLSHSILGTSSGSVCPHIWHTSSSVNSSSSKSSVIRMYALSPTLNVSPSTVTEDKNWRKCFSLAFLARLRCVLCAFFDTGAASDAGMASADAGMASADAGMASADAGMASADAGDLLVAACVDGAPSSVPFVCEQTSVYASAHAS